MAYGWSPDVPDYRDYAYTPKLRQKALPATVDLRKHPENTANSISVTALQGIVGEEIVSLRSRIREAVRGQPYIYERIPRTVEGLGGALSEGLPFLCGLSAYSALESDRVAQTGVLHFPKPTESLLGGLVVIGVGYVMRSKRFIVQTSFGPGWGRNGGITVPFEYLLHSHLAGDFWLIRRAV
jgi:hypothetical protein